MVALVLDQYWTLCRRFKNIVFTQQKHNKHIHFILAFLSLMACVYSIPRFFELKITYFQLYNVYLISYTNLKQNEMYMLLYRIIGSLIFYSAVPYIVVFFVFTRCWFEVRNSHKMRLILNVNNQVNSNKH